MFFILTSRQKATQSYSRTRHCSVKEDYPMNMPKRSLLGASLAVLIIIVAVTATPVCARDTLNPGEALRPGERLTSDNQQYSLVLEQSGNLVLYAGRQALWSSNTQGQRVQTCTMQSDGNLVLFLRNGQPIWSTNTSDKPGSFLVLQNDGNLVIYQPYAVWASNTERGPRDERRGRWHGLSDRGDRDRWDNERASSSIRVVAATYGKNCGAQYGNVTRDLAAVCDGKSTCEYTIDTRTMGDPAFGCPKDYFAEWQCENNPQKGNLSVLPEAGNGTAIVLRCPVR
jgi:hypothetical protein